jgi:tripartite-type tricarboxylate transporter receptor subunit TctC
MLQRAIAMRVNLASLLRSIFIAALAMPALVPFAPGGAADILARTAAQFAST